MDTPTFERELPAHLPALRALAGRLIGNRDDAQDVLQEALLKASRSLSEFRGDSSLKTWLFSITTRVAIDHLRASKRWKTDALVEACDERGAASTTAKFADPTVSFDVTQHISFCFTCVGRSLDPSAQAAIVLREMFDLSNAEAARVIGLTEPAFRHTLSDARQTMTREYDGLCALVNKTGACHQCRTLRQLAPERRKGPALPATPLSFDERLDRARAAAGDHALNDYFFDYLRRLQAERGPR